MRILKNILIYTLLVLAVFFLIKFLTGIPDIRLQDGPIQFNLNRLEEAIEKDRIQKAIIIEGEKNSEIKGRLRGTFQEFRATIPKNSVEKYLERMLKQGMELEVENSQGNFWIYLLFNSWLTVLIFFAFLLFVIPKIFNSGNNRVFSFGKSRAKMFDSHKKQVTFSDVAGIEEAKEELYEIVEFLREPQKFQRLGGKIPKGVLLIGPPGSGKTLLARAIAGEAKVPFFSISGSDFVEMFVGVGASRVRDLFEKSKKSAPCIIFIDEIDAVGRRRGAGLGGGHDEREQTLNQLLVEMDGFESSGGIILIAATNRPDILDPALTRPGRFDRQVVVPLPDIKGREGIIRVHARFVPIHDDVDFKILARGTPGLSGAQLANMVNEAALIAAGRNRKKVTMADFEESKDKILMGKERRSEIINKEEKQSVACHEAGHAVVAYFSPDADPVRKVSIIPRGQALGITMQLPEEDKHNYSKKYLESLISILLAGRLAEEIFLNDCTTGASNDLERVSDIARKMVCQWGMSDELGPMAFGKIEEHIFLGKEISRQKDYSESTAVKIDREVKRIITQAHQRAEKILKENKGKVTCLAEALLKYETLDYNDIEKIMTDGKMGE